MIQISLEEDADMMEQQKKRTVTLKGLEKVEAPIDYSNTKIKIEEEEEPCIVNRQDSEANTVISGFPTVALKIEEEEESWTMDDQDCEQEFHGEIIKMEPEEETWTSPNHNCEQGPRWESIFSTCRKTAACPTTTQVQPHSQTSDGPLPPPNYECPFFYAGMATKRKKVVVSMEQKLEAIKRLDKGEKMKDVADEYGVARVTVGDWKRNRLEIEKWCSSRITDGSLKERKTMKKCDYEKVSEALYVWFTQSRDKGVLISGPILQQKALHFRKEFNEGDPDFTASVGWLDRWKKRYGIRQLSACGEKLSSNYQEMEAFKKRFQDFVETESLTGDQIFNCDETSLDYKMLPNMSLAARTEAAAHGYKRNKERLTILACSNATANHKMDLAMIGKSKNPRALKTISTNALPVKYYNQKSAQMTREIFKDWFFKEFVPSTEKYLKENGLPRKAVLLLDNAPTHPDAEELQDGDIKAMFLPPNATAICQPMDQGILDTLKRNYCRKLLSTMIEEIEEGQDITEKLKRINVKEVAYWAARAWTDVRAPTIARSWMKLLGEDKDEIMERESTDETEEGILPLVHRIPGCENVSSQEVESWMNEDHQYQITDEEIVALINDNGDGEEIDDQASAAEPLRISHEDGVRALEAAMMYIGQQEEATGIDIMMLQRWRDLAAKKQQLSEKQARIAEFLKSSQN
nr:PREDICTED: jerky protein homolog-like isoform X1 [Anolis carolinensis]|eukprot:XP_016847311.1 PREDICTED: jerky protein homolog-like isoform X1 [Anolis carolinensis]